MRLPLILLLVTYVTCVEKTDNDTFQATKEWQPIKDGNY